MRYVIKKGNKYIHKSIHFEWTTVLEKAEIYKNKKEARAFVRNGETMVPVELKEVK